MNDNVKLDCVSRLELLLQHEPQTNINNIFDLIKKNSNCYNCPENKAECTAEHIKELYQRQQASRDIIPVKPRYNLFDGFNETIFKIK